MITLENYEEFMIMAADGELAADEAAALEAFLETHPHLKAEMALYNSARLTPDLSMTYDGKDALLKEEQARRTIVFIPRWRSYAAAAGIAALLGIGYFWLMEHREYHTIQVAETQSRAAASLHAIASANTPDVRHDTAIVAPVTPAPDNAGDDNNTAARYAAGQRRHGLQPTQPQEVIAASRHSAGQRQRKTDIQEQAAPAARNVDLTPMTGIAVAPLKKLQVAANGFSDAQPLVFDGDDVAEEDKRASWINKLPIDDDKKEKLANVADALSTGAKKVSSLKEEIADHSLSIRIEKRKLILSF